MKAFIAMFLTLVSVFSMMNFSCAFPQTNTSEIYFNDVIDEKQSREESQDTVLSKPVSADPMPAQNNTIEQAQSIESAMLRYRYDESQGLASEALTVAEVPQDIFYEDVYETVYATTDVNIRTGPGTEFSVLGISLYGRSVTRTGIGSNGWSRVIYNGDTAYMASEYLSTDNPVSSGPLGTAGRLTIPSVSIDVALYACSSSGEYAAEQQRIVDDIDSAAYITQVYTNRHIIADHNHQGFDAIKSCVPYETYAYINFGSSIQRYVCTGIGSGLNLGNNLLDWNGRSLNYDPISGGLAMYTCNENSTNVTITYWEPA